MREYQVVWNGVNDGRDGDLLGVPRFDGRRYIPELAAPPARVTPAPAPTPPAKQRRLSARVAARAAFVGLFPDRAVVDLPSAGTAVRVLQQLADSAPAEWLSALAIARAVEASRFSVYIVLNALHAAGGCVAVRKVPTRRRAQRVYQLRRGSRA